MSRASRKAYEAIRDRILSGEFAPGAHLKEEELAEVCGVSRTPIRDALRTLSAEDYVRVVPNHGTFVSDYTERDIEDIFSLRAMLEGYAARMAAHRASPEQIAELREISDSVTKMLESGEEPDRVMWLNANRRFHSIVTEAANSERLANMIARLVEQPVLVRTAATFDRADLTRSNQHHLDLVDAIADGNGDWAEAVMSSHILAAYQTYRRGFARKA